VSGAGLLLWMLPDVPGCQKQTHANQQQSYGYNNLKKHINLQSNSLFRQGEALQGAKKLEESAYAAPDRPFFLFQIVV